VSRVGLIGPTRMDYSGNMAAVRAVASYLSRILDA
jgi:heat-inducible transcriptional repressor